MKAWRYYGKRDIRLEEVPLRKPAEDEVLIKVYSCGICQTDVDEFMAGPKFFSPIPIIPGHEFGGEVVEVGSEVSKKWKGKKITVAPLISCENCTYCKRGKPNLCENLTYYGIIGADGGFAEYAIVKEKALVEVDDLEIAHFGELTLIALRLLNEAKSVCPWNEKTLVVGGGPLGIITAVLFKKQGISVDICEVRDPRREVLEKLGFQTHPLLQEVPNDSYDVIIDCAGEDPVVPYAFPEEVNKVKKMGALILAGVYFGEVTIDLLPLLTREAGIHPIFTYTKKELEQLKDTMKDCKDVYDKITCKVPFVELEDALLELETRKEIYLKLALKYAD